SFDPRMPGALAAFHQGLRETGFVEGRDISIEYRWADGHYDRLLSLAAELVGRSVAVIWAFDLPSTFAAKAATKSIPIVFLVDADPAKVGLVESFSRPNGNLTASGQHLQSLFKSVGRSLNVRYVRMEVRTAGIPKQGNRVYRWQKLMQQFHTFWSSNA